VLGEKIVLVYVDTRSEKTEAANAMARLIDKEKVVYSYTTLISCLHFSLHLL